MKLDNFIYFDSYATVPCSLDNVSFTAKYLKGLNSSAPYSVNNKLKGYSIESALFNKLAQILKVDKKNIILNSGGSEGNSNIIVSKGIFGNGEIVCSSLDHPSILNGVHELWKRNIPTSLIKVVNGRLRAEDVLQKISYKTNLVILTHVFSEIGMINDIENIARLVKQRVPNCHIHVDAVQSFMKLKNSSFVLDNIDSLAVSFHKIGGDKGCGFLWVKDVDNLFPIVFGNHNNKKRGGTSNISGFASAFYAIQEMERLNVVQNNQKELFNYLLKELNVYSKFTKIYTDSKFALGNCLVVAFTNIDNRIIQNFLYEKGIIVGTGSACSSECVYKNGKISPIIDSFKSPINFSKPIRISWSNRTTKACMDKLLNELIPFVHKFYSNKNDKNISRGL